MAYTITIIIPVYNSANTIDKCLESIVNQTAGNWRVILVDDGSKDGSNEKCRQWIDKDSRISLVTQNNQGAGAARNEGLRHCHSKWVTFIDADDWVEPTYIENFHVENLSDRDLSVQGFKRVGAHNQFLGEFKNFAEETVALHELSDSRQFLEILDYGHTIGKVYDIELFRNNRIDFPRGFPLSEDHVLYFNVLAHTKSIHLQSGMLYNYFDQQNGTNLSRQPLTFQEAMLRFEALKASGAKLVSAITASNIAISQWINNFIYTSGLSLVLQGIYKSGNDDDIRYTQLQQLRDNTDFVTHFRPHSLKGKMMKWMIMHLPISFSDKALTHLMPR